MDKKGGSQNAAWFVVKTYELSSPYLWNWQSS